MFDRKDSHSIFLPIRVRTPTGQLSFLNKPCLPIWDLFFVSFLVAIFIVLEFLPILIYLLPLKKLTSRFVYLTWWVGWDIPHSLLYWKIWSPIGGWGLKTLWHSQLSLLYACGFQYPVPTSTIPAAGSHASLPWWKLIPLEP